MYDFLGHSQLNFQAMEHHGYEREIISRLFVALSPKSISRELFCEGFQQALDYIDVF
jgi:hypothetical protein